MGMTHALAAGAALALFVLLLRTEGKRAAIYAIVVLWTMPVWFAGPSWTSSAIHFRAPALTAVVTRAAYGLGPWAPLLPFAIAARRRFTSSSIAVLLLAAETVVDGPPLATLILAACVGIMLADLDRVKPSLTVLALGIVTLGAILAHDIRASPDRVLQAIAIPTPGKPSHERILAGAIGFVSAGSAVALLAPPTRLGRGAIVIACGAVAGIILRAQVYPQLLARGSPEGALAGWNALRQPGDELGRSDDDPARWLTEDAAGRRFVVLRSSELPRVNAAYRAARGENVPIVAGEGAFLLGVSALRPGEQNTNPLDRIVRSTPPEGLRSTPARLGEAIELVGWTKSDRHLQIALRVHASLSGYCTFIHIDHVPTRFGREHRAHEDYPMSLWRTGDVIVDDFEVELPPSFGRGTYPLYWGLGVLPCEDDRRMPVLSGRSDGRGRVELGRWEVP